MKSLFTSARLEVQKRNVEVQIPSLSVIVELFESCVSVFLVMFIEVLIRLNDPSVGLKTRLLEEGLDVGSDPSVL